jgi:cytochrome c5
VTFSISPFIKRFSILGAVCFALGLSSLAGAARSGEQTFNTYCVACHMSGVAGAPKFGDQADWQPRIDKGIDTLLKDAISGIKAMPPRGLCFDCNDDELKLAIEYMIDNSKD